MIIDSIIKQVTNEGCQFLLENNQVITNANEHKIRSYFVKRFFDNKSDVVEASITNETIDAKPNINFGLTKRRWHYTCGTSIRESEISAHWIS